MPRLKAPIRNRLRFVVLSVKSFLIALLVLAFAAVAQAADGSATATVHQANDTLQGLLRRKVTPGSPEEKQQANEVTAKLQNFLDVDELGRRAMRDQWSKLTPAQQTEFTKLLREIVEGHYVRALRSELDYEVAYLGEKPHDEETTVSTELRVVHKGKKQVISVDYALRRDKGSWRVFDIVTDGVGLVENYRGQFNQVIAKEGVEGLLGRMRKKSLAGS
jgi:phospholipid transport system substrate-binding protein